MFEVSSKYGNIVVNGKNIDIGKANIEDLDAYLKKVEVKREELIEKQHNYLGQIID